MGIGDWGLGIWGLGGGQKPKHPNPKQKHPNPKPKTPQIKKKFKYNIIKINNFLKKFFNFFNKKKKNFFVCLGVGFWVLAFGGLGVVFPPKPPTPKPQIPNPQSPFINSIKKVQLI